MVPLDEVLVLAAGAAVELVLLEPLSLEVDVVVEVALVPLLDALELDDEDEPALSPPFLFDPPEYRSEYQPPPFKMKLPDVICRRAVSLWHCAHSLIGSSVMRCTRSNSAPQASQR